MTSTKEHPALIKTVAATTLPISLADAKAHLDIAASVTGHDDKITQLITDATEIFEHDTSRVCITSTFTHTTDSFADIRFELQRVQSISSVKYYDSGNDQQTLSASIYQLDTARRKVRLAYDQVWPAIASRWDAVEVTYVAGAGDSESEVDGMWKRAILLLVGHYFENVDDFEKVSHEKTAYENLVGRMMRSSYP